MRILYGVQATGNGHINRSRELLRELRAGGNEVDVIFSGRDPSKLWDVDDFKPYRIFRGLTFVVRKGRICHFRTAISQNIFVFLRDSLKLDVRSYDIVLTDFEPVTAWAAGFGGKKRIGIGHQYAFFYKVPEQGKGIIGKIVMKTFAPVDIKVGLHWHHWDNPILPPIIKQMQRPERIIKNKIIVYLAFERLDEVKKLLSPFKEYEFFIYHWVKEAMDEGNLHMRPFSREGFLKDLYESAGVICNAGFELPSEAIHLGKKLLVRPIAGQFEQLSNGVAIEELGLGMQMNYLDKRKVEEWLEAAQKKKLFFPNTAYHLARWIERAEWDTLPELSKELWSKAIWEECK